MSSKKLLYHAHLFVDVGFSTDHLGHWLPDVMILGKRHE